ncbi:MAG: hypothetical protein KDB03_27115 [Planctomycetales bacterium]|nr:hypothetical protein [Planctomycetales bacterium]
MSETTQVNPYASSRVQSHSPKLDRRLCVAKLLLFATLRFLGIAFLLGVFRVFIRDRIPWEIAFFLALTVTVSFTLLHWHEGRCSHNRIVVFSLGIAAYIAGACSMLLLHCWIVYF